MINTGLLYAAGRGTRMGALTNDTPKPLLELNGRKLIDYALSEFKAAGINEVHVNAAYLADQVERHFEPSEVKVHVEPDGPYETGGTLKHLAKELPDAISTLNSDVLFFGEAPIPNLLAKWRDVEDQYDALLLLKPRELASEYLGQGDFFWDGTTLERRGERKDAPFIFAGAQIIRPKRALEFSEKIFSTNLIWDKLMEERRIGAVIYHGGWMDLGHADSLEKARSRLKN